MNVRRLLLLVAASCASAAPLTPLLGQQVQQLPRVSPTTGLADSSLFLCVDSTKTLTRACKFSDVQKRLAYKSFDSLVAAGARIPGTLNLTGGSITGSPTATFGAITTSGCTGCAPAVADSATGAARAQILTTARTIGGVSFNGSANIIPDTATGVVRAQTLTTARALWGQSFNGSAAITGSLTGVGDISGGASSMNLLAGTGASRRLVLQTTTSGSAATTLLRGNELQQSLFADGLVGTPSIGFAADSLLGWYRHGTAGASDTLALASNGINTLNLSGGATAKITGGAGSMTVAAGTGNSRTMTLQTTTSAGTAKNVLVLGADTSATFLGQTFAYVGAGGSGQVPAYSFVGNASTGMYAATGSVKFMAAGTPTLAMSATAISAQLPVGSPDATAAAPGFTFLNSATTGFYRFGADTIGVSTGGVASLGIRGGASPTIFGGAGNLTIQAGTGNSRKLLLQTTTSAGTATTAVRFNEVQGALFTAGTTGRPGIAGQVDSTTGVVLTGGTFSISVSGGDKFDIDASNIYGYLPIVMTNGSAAAPTYSFQNGTSNGMYLGNNGTTDTTVFVASGSVFARGFADTLIVPSKLKAIGLTSEGSTQSALCVTNGGGQVFINAAATCTVSARRFKTDIAPLSYDLAHRIVMQTRPVTFAYKSGGGKAIGVIAEQADSIDSRLATRDAKGQVNSANYEQFTMALLVEVQQLRRQVDSLIVAGKKKP